MGFLIFLVEAVLVSLSGVLAPGPITSVSVGYGSEDPWAGTQVAVGHGLVEFPVMIAVFLGVGALVEVPLVRSLIGLVGGVFLLYLGVDMLRSIGVGAVQPVGGARSPLAAGALLSLGNPYFLIWWMTVGAGLILRSAEFGLLGFAAFAVGHWLCDLSWDTFLSALSFQGGQFFGRWFQKVIFGLAGGFLLFYGARLLWEAVRHLGGL